MSDRPLVPRRWVHREVLPGLKPIDLELPGDRDAVRQVVAVAAGSASRALAIPGLIVASVASDDAALEGDIERGVCGARIPLRMASAAVGQAEKKNYIIF